METDTESDTESTREIKRRRNPYAEATRENPLTAHNNPFRPQEPEEQVRHPCREEEEDPKQEEHRQEDLRVNMKQSYDRLVERIAETKGKTYQEIDKMLDDKEEHREQAQIPGEYRGQEEERRPTEDRDTDQSDDSASGEEEEEEDEKEE